MRKFQVENKKKVNGKQIAQAVAAVLVPILLFYLLECYTHNPFVEVRPWAQFFNIALLELIAGILFCLIGNLKWTYRILSIVTMLYGIANAYVMRFRTNPIVPWDIFSWRTAASVADSYDFAPDVRMVVVSAFFVILFVTLRFVKIKWGTFVNPKRWLVGVVPFVILLTFTGRLQNENFQNHYRLYNKLFTPVYMTKVDGIPVTFTMNLAYMAIDKPAGYHKQEAQELLKEYETEEQGQKDTLPNIIVVMNESFSDLNVLGNFATNEDYMPYLHSLQKGCKNTVTGMLNVSVCGGNTANTEFEFLTGNTMTFLPQGSIPYQQYLTGECDSLVAHLRELGYETVATHPYNATGWNRNLVYPWLGFERSIFVEEYQNAWQVRNYVSDNACVEKIISLYEQKEPLKPLFVFNVTMQNHGGYQDAYNNFTPDVFADHIDNFSVSQYLSLIKRSDQSLQNLISYFSNASEKTVIVFFGDHQPNDTVAAPILAQNGMIWNQLSEDELKLRYQVPYVIWANYDIEAETEADTSANFLGAEVLKRAGVPTSAYENFLLELNKEYPIVSPVRIVKEDGTETALQKEKTGMDVYQKLQYYQLFDRKEEE